MIFLERFAVFFTQPLDGLHVDLVEGGQHGGGLRRLQQALGHPCTQPGHRYPFLRAVFLNLHQAGRRCYRMRGLFRGIDRLFCYERCRLLCFDMCLYIALGKLPLPAGRGDPFRIEVMVCNQFACRRSRPFLFLASIDRRGFLYRTVSHIPCLMACAICTDHPDDLVGGHRVTVCKQDLFQYTVFGSRDFQYHLVRFDIDQCLITPYHVTGLLVPAGHYTITDGFRQGRYFYFYCHGVSRPSALLTSSACCCTCRLA